MFSVERMILSSKVFSVERLIIKGVFCGEVDH